MRFADAATIFRTALILLVVYLVIIRYDPAVTIAVFVIATLLDAFDGYLAVMQTSRGKVGLAEYFRATVMNDAKARKKVLLYKSKAGKEARFGPRIDVAGDRVAEYSMWIVFTYLGIIPIALLLAVVIRHSFADALMGARGTSGKMKSRFARLAYSSNFSRAGINVVKILGFAYLILMYVSGYPAIIGYALVGILFTFIMVRGAAEIYESLAFD